MFHRLSFFIWAILLGATPSLACDICALHNSVESHKPKAESLHLGVEEQFTGFDTIRNGGNKVENTLHQNMQSSITHLTAGYDFSDEISTEVRLPYINRRFRRAEANEAETGTEAGIGDLVLEGRYIPFKISRPGYNLVTQLRVGIKLPTGDSDRLKEELEEHHDKHEGHEHEEEEISSAIHGHDLALGSGSVDVPVGAHLLYQVERFLVIGGIQYAIRTEGDHDYKYANDLTFQVSPAYYVWLSDGYSLAVHANFTGEIKGKDRGPSGAIQGDTGTKGYFLGPQVSLTASDRLTFDVGAAWPVNVENTGLQATPTYRLHSTISYRF